MKPSNILKLIIAVAISELAGVIGSFFTVRAIPDWYANLAKPEFAPPNWLFGPVWTALFVLMGIAAFLIWKNLSSAGTSDGPEGQKRRKVKIALGIFLGQLVLNSIWSVIFFGLQNPGAAFVELIFLWLAILATIIAFAKISKPAAWLLLPYILWVSFAGYLNFSIWQLQLKQPEEIVCAQDAKICSDGSYVSRVAPGCEFAGCPADSGIWKNITDEKTGVTFYYPDHLLTEYIHVFDWPPKVQVLNEAFTCTEAGTVIDRAGETKKAAINGREYCVTTEAEGAAGSIYTTYAYAFPKASKTIILTFSIRSVQCANYDDPQKTACELEREVFDMNGIVDRMAKSLTLKQ